MRNDRKNMIVELSIKFALDIIDYCTILETGKHFIFSRQILKSGTSIGAIFMKPRMQKARMILSTK
jgi:hypothetical protein